MIFECGRHTSHDIYINGQNIEIVKSFKYLGVHLFKNNNEWHSTHLTLNDICSSISTKQTYPSLNKSSCTILWLSKHSITAPKYSVFMNAKT